MDAPRLLSSVFLLTVLAACAGDETKSAGDSADPGTADGADGGDEGSGGDDDGEGSGGDDGGEDGGEDGDDDGGEPDPRFAEVAAAVEADLDRSLATGAQVAVWMDGEVHWVGGFGSASALEDRAVTEDTLFMIGSDTKKLAALSVLQRVGAGELDLEATVGELLPAFEPRRATDFTGATVHELLSHQGGVSEWYDDTSEGPDERLAEAAYGPFARQAVSLAPPGTFYNYSNPNFSIAGLIDEELQGEPWGDVVQTGLFVPLGMDHSHSRKADLVGPVSEGTGFASLSSTSVGPVSFEDTWEDAFGRPAGMVWSTASDQARLAGFLVHGDESVLSDELLGLLRTPQVPSWPDLSGAYGYGLAVDRGFSLGRSYYDLPIWSHGGNTLTHTSTFVALPEQDFAISILSNGYGDDFTGTLVAAIDALVELPEPTTAPDRPAVDWDVVAGFAGTYEDPDNVGIVEVTVEEGTLSVSMPALDAAGVSYRSTLEPISSQVWLATIEGTQYDLSFFAGDGDEAWIRNRAFVAHRSSVVSVAPAPAGELDVDKLRARLRTGPLLSHRRLTLPGLY